MRHPRRQSEQRRLCRQTAHAAQDIDVHNSLTMSSFLSFVGDEKEALFRFNEAFSEQGTMIVCRCSRNRGCGRMTVFQDLSNHSISGRTRKSAATNSGLG